MKVSEHIAENTQYIRSKCEHCDDVIIRPMKLGKEQKTDCLVVFIEVAVSNMMLSDSVIGKFINRLWTLPEDQMRSFIEKNGAGISDTGTFATMEEAMEAMLAGNAIFFMDGYDRAVKIGSKGYPDMGVT